MDSIFALSSGNLPSGIAVLRVSGSETIKIIEALTSNSAPSPRYMQYTSFFTEYGELIDKGMVVYFKAPYSFTGEDSAEFHIHGSKASVNLFLSTLSNFKNCRLANPGEFSQRAFQNGKIDLIQAESLADLIEAETEAQRKLTMSGTSKQLSLLYNKWRQLLIDHMAMLTSILDFSEEEDINAIDDKKIWLNLKQLVISIEKHLYYTQATDIIKNGLKIVLIGKPNVGKSSLLNKLCYKDIAIVSDIEGTTRDVLEGKIILNNIEIYFYDTAGIRETSDVIEQLGIEKANEYIEQSDIIFYLKDINDKSDFSINYKKPIWKIFTKCDVSRETFNQDNIFYISIYNDKSIKNLLDSISAYVKNIMPKSGEILPIKQRHINLLKNTIHDINFAIEHNNLPIEIRAEYIRSASYNIGKIIGKIDIENILDVVFSKFCIGK